MKYSDCENRNMIYHGNHGIDSDIEVNKGKIVLVYTSSADVDEKYIDSSYDKNDEFIFKKNAGLEKWNRAMVNNKDQLVLYKKDLVSDITETEILSEAKTISHPKVISGKYDFVFWVQEDDHGFWEINSFINGSYETLMIKNDPITDLAVTKSNDTIYLALSYINEKAEIQIEIVTILNNKLNLIAQIHGQDPEIIIDEGSNIWIVFSRENDSRYDIALRSSKDEFSNEIFLSDHLDNAFNLYPSICLHKEYLNVVWESIPSWGEDEQLGRFRDIYCRKINIKTNNIEDANDTANGKLPIPAEAFHDLHLQNYSPIFPRMISNDNTLICTYKCFDFKKSRSFGWHLYKLQLDNNSWSKPVKLSKNPGFPDTEYGICFLEDDLYISVNCCDHEYSLEKGRGSMRSGRNRVELIRTPVTFFKEAKFRGIPAVKPSIDIKEPVNEIENVTLNNRFLVWGDLHSHSSYSKCTSANDGSPDNVMLWQKYLLKCKVLSLSEHVTYMSAVEFKRVFDTVERYKSENTVLLYGVEWGRAYAHDTIFYAIDRRVFNELRGILISELELTGVFRQIKRHLPKGSVVAIRHFHGEKGGEYSVIGEKTTYSFDPEIETAMEVMQGRGDHMIEKGPFAKFRLSHDLPAFPTNFLVDDKKIGLVGGSDHSRGDGVFNYCLTGFWVREFNANAVFDALKNRKVIAVACGKVVIWIDVNKIKMGEAGATKKPINVNIYIQSPTHIRNLSIWRDGKWIFDSSDPEIKDNRYTFVDDNVSQGKHCYIARTESLPITDKRVIVAYTSPVWVKL